MTPVVNILLVEDHVGDVTLTRRALVRIPLTIALHVAVDGIEAQEFLLQQGPHKNAPRPSLILLDLNMPRMDGREVLRWLETTPLRSIPVIILTTSSAKQDIKDAYGLHANAYIVKPVAFEDFVLAMRAIEQFWLHLAQLP